MGRSTTNASDAGPARHLKTPVTAAFHILAVLSYHERNNKTLKRVALPGPRWKHHSLALPGADRHRRLDADIPVLANSAHLGTDPVSVSSHMVARASVRAVLAAASHSAYRRQMPKYSYNIAYCNRHISMPTRHGVMSLDFSRSAPTPRRSLSQLWCINNMPWPP